MGGCGQERAGETTSCEGSHVSTLLGDAEKELKIQQRGVISRTENAKPFAISREGSKAGLSDPNFDPDTQLVAS